MAKAKAYTVTITASLVVTKSCEADVLKKREDVITQSITVYAFTEEQALDLAGPYMFQPVRNIPELISARGHGGNKDGD